MPVVEGCKRYVLVARWPFKVFLERKPDSFPRPVHGRARAPIGLIKPWVPLSQMPTERPGPEEKLQCLTPHVTHFTVLSRYGSGTSSRPTFFLVLQRAGRVAALRVRVQVRSCT
jgi:hypothetical protein